MSGIVVWIAEGCITCNACEGEYPEVFVVEDESCFIVADARTDGGFDTNEGSMSPLKDGFDLEAIQGAAEECPVDVIIVEVAGTGDSAVAVADEAPAETADTPDVDVAAEPSSLDGDRSVLILSGSQSGNAEGVASKAAKMAGDFGLEATVKSMDEVQISDLASNLRIMVVCSTWGEGEMPDNAEDLWNAANEGDAPSLSASHFSVCGLGDSSYEFFCQCGIDWDGWFAGAGANRITERVDCDVDFDGPADAWMTSTLAHLAAVDGEGVFHEERVEAILSAASGGTSSPSADAAFDIPNLFGKEVQLDVKVFRYDPATCLSGHDVWRCAVPDSLSILELMRLLKSTEDGSLTFRDGDADDATTAISVNGRNILPGRMAVSHFANSDGVATLRLDPLDGFEVIRDICVDHTEYQIHLANSEPWMHAASRAGVAKAQGDIGAMEASAATSQHLMTDIPSFQLLHATSDTTPHNRNYIGPAVIARKFARYNDPRSSKVSKQNILSLLSSPEGVKAEADFSSLRRAGRAGVTTSNTLLQGKRLVLEHTGFSGPHGRHVWWFTETVKLSGQLNETALAVATLRLGMVKNVVTGVLPRMAMGFTRTGGPIMRDKQALLLPPASIGKMPKMVNKPVDNHHEVVALFNKYDRRF